MYFIQWVFHSVFHRKQLPATAESTESDQNSKARSFITNMIIYCSWLFCVLITPCKILIILHERLSVFLKKYGTMNIKNATQDIAYAQKIYGYFHK